MKEEASPSEFVVATELHGFETKKGEAFKLWPFLRRYDRILRTRHLAKPL